MDTTPDRRFFTVDARLDECLDRVRYARAAELARSGNYAEAEGLLSPNGQQPSAAHECDLLARIAVHRGELEKARKLWETALTKDPQNASYRECLAGLKQGSAEGRSSHLLIAVAVGAVLIIVLAVLMLRPSHQRESAPGLASGGVKAPSHEAAAQPAAEVARPPAVQEKAESPAGAEMTSAVSRLEESLERDRQLRQGAANSLNAHLDVLQSNQVVLMQAFTNSTEHIAEITRGLEALSLQQHAEEQILLTTHDEVRKLQLMYVAAARATTNVQTETLLEASLPGVTVLRNADGWDVRFNTGLFDRDDHFRIGAKARIAAAIKALVQTQQKFRIDVLGFAQQEPATWPWTAPPKDGDLALRRARRVLLAIEAMGVIPPAKLHPAVGKPEEQPFPGQGLDNRTAVLRVISENSGEK